MTFDVGARATSRIPVTRLLLLASLFTLAAPFSAATASAQAIHGPGGHIPDFGASPTKVSVASGLWSNPATWNPPAVPNANDVVRISHDVVFDTNSGVADIVSVEPGGALR